MVDYSKHDETTLRNMLETSCDLDERQQLRSVLRRLKKHANTVCFSPNMENVINNTRNHASIFALNAELEKANCRSAPSSPFTRRNEMLERCQSGRNISCKDAPDESGSNKNGIRDRSTLRVINGWNRTPQTDGNLKSGVLIESARDPVECLKRNLGKTMSEPIINDDLKVYQSRLVIQQMLAPRIAAAAKTEDRQISRAASFKAEKNNLGKSATPSVIIRTDVDSNQPTFFRPLCDAWVEDGKTAVLECSVLARYEPMVLWYRNSEPLRLIDGKHLQTYDGDVAQLTIQNVGCDDLGVYECTARNSYGKATSNCHLSFKDNSRELWSFVKPKVPSGVTVRRSETLPSSILNARLASSARRQMHGQMAAIVKPSSREELSSIVKPGEEVEEEAVARSTRTEKASDGGKVTTTTTVTTHKAKDGGHLLTKQTKQITRVGGVGTTNYSINKCSAEEIAERLAGIFEKKAMNGTTGIILVKTENWNSQDGITHRNEKSQIWEAPRLALSFNEADFADTQTYSDDIGFNPLQRKAVTVKQKLLEWCRITLRDYQRINIANFSTSWNDGMAFCALVHHFIPDAFDYNQLDPKNRRENFQLAFETAEKRAGIMPLLDVEDMVKMTVPDWKSVFMYIQSVYREFVLPKQEKLNPNNAADASQ